MKKIYLLVPLSPLINLFVITYCFFHPKLTSSSVDPYYLACSNPKAKTCGDGQNIEYPFYIQDKQEHFCGYPGFNLTCNDKGQPILRLENTNYVVQNIYYDNQSLRVSSAAVLDTNSTSCLPPIQSLSLPEDRFRLATNQKELLLLYNCNSTLLHLNDTSGVLLKDQANCSEENTTGSTLAVFEDDPLLDNVSGKCGNVVAVPVDVYVDEGEITNQGVKGLLERGFLLDWLASNCSTCEASGGKCGFIDAIYNFRCFCPDRPHASQCSPERKKLALRLGLGLGFGVPFITLVVFVFVRRHKKRHGSAMLLSTSSNSDPSSKEDLEGGSVYFGVPVFSYRELEEATNNFSSENELGDGGFGTVYYGKLKDGREVAVKRMYEHNFRRVEQFMNEIEILTRMRHRNLVSLYGCTSRRSKELLLVYEYIPNGTVADHLHGDRAKSDPMTWPIRLNIAIETASALAYLHASDIIHRDVKTNNILLEKNFSVKVADFGLSRLFPNDVTHVSTCPQGTPGYVDPEYYQCYQLTDKSDVYSFGVVLIELISSMPAVDITRDRSDINLANLAIKRIQKCEFDELIDPCIEYKSNEEIKRMATCVAELAFQCLQQDKDMRPTMVNVLKELMTIQSGDSEKNLQEIENMDDELNNRLPPPSPQDCDEDALLKNIRLPPSPISVTDKWASSSSAASNVSG